MQFVRFILLIVMVVNTSACATTRPGTSGSLSADLWQEEPQIEVGRANLVIDFLGNVFGIPAKIILWHYKVQNHNIGPRTREVIERHLVLNEENMRLTKIRLNQFDPVGEFRRLRTNRKLKWWWRVFPGVPVTIFSLAGRVYGGDHYNPYTDTINIYSDLPSIALHEAGHAVDFDQHSKNVGFTGLYALARIFPPVTLYQEYVASEHAFEYLKEIQDEETDLEAYRMLIPAYGTYLGGAYGIVPFGSIAGAGLGHLVAIVPRKNRARAYDVYEEIRWEQTSAAAASAPAEKDDDE